MCHDPHSTQYRVVRDGLINAVVDKNLGTYPYDPEKSKKTTIVKVTFRDFRANAIQNYIRGKITKAEFWLGQLIDAYAAGKAAGLSEDVLKAARESHDRAHILWEWWTAENSDGFHNPSLRGSPSPGASRNPRTRWTR